MNERDEPMKGLPEFLRALSDSAVVKMMTAYAGESRLLGWASEVEASRNLSAVKQAWVIADALSKPGAERLREFYEIGPVQRAAVESFVHSLGVPVAAKTGDETRNGDTK